MTFIFRLDNCDYFYKDMNLMRVIYYVEMIPEVTYGFRLEEIALAFRIEGV